jgi:DNA-binding response OmpR family regulator
MKKILVIDESRRFREYLSGQLQAKGFEVIMGANGLDGLVKLRAEIPDLIIMDYFLSRKSSMDLLKEKAANPNVSKIPVIMAASKLDRSKLVEVAQFNVKKFFSKPVRMDALLRAVSDILKVEVQIDTTPCIIEAHLNDEILFVEIARGLNAEKIELLHYKISELLELYELEYPRVLVMMTDVEILDADKSKFRELINTIIEYAGPYARHMKILTKSDIITEFIQSNSDFEMIEVTDNLNKAMDDLLGLRPDDVAHDEVVRQKLLSATEPKKDRDETIQLRFDEPDQASGSAADAVENDETAKAKRRITVAIVDDDPIIHQLVRTVFANAGWSIVAFENGRAFVESLGEHTYDLVFLDIMMPEMDGFQVLNHVKSQSFAFPVIVLSSLSQHEAVAQAMRLGVRSYLMKPFKPESLIRKTAEILNSNF